MEKTFFVSEIMKEKLLSGEAFDWRFSETKNELHNCKIKITLEKEKEATITESDLEDAIRHSYEYNAPMDLKMFSPDLLKKRIFR